MSSFKNFTREKINELIHLTESYKNIIENTKTDTET